jgi:hypothetical protein
VLEYIMYAVFLFVCFAWMFKMWQRKHYMLYAGAVVIANFLIKGLEIVYETYWHEMGLTDYFCILLILLMLTKAVIIIFKWIQPAQQIDKPVVENPLSEHFSYRMIQVIYLGSMFIINTILIFIALIIGISGNVIFNINFSIMGVFYSYVALNLFKEAMLYLFLQKKFSWEWLTTIFTIDYHSIFRYLKTSNEAYTTKENS